METQGQFRCHTCDSRVKGVFCDLHEKQLDDLDRAKTTNTFVKNQVLFYEGNRPTGVFSISHGRVKLYKSDCNGNQKIVRIASPGEVIGYRSILVDEPYTATAQAIDDVRVCFVDRDAFENLLKSDPVTAYNLMKKMAHEIRDAQNSEFSLAHKSVRERLAELFIVLSNRYGSNANGKLELGIKLARQEIADLIGVSQETAIRMIRQFIEDELIETHKKEIYVIDKQGLLEITQLPM